MLPWELHTNVISTGSTIIFNHARIMQSGPPIARSPLTRLTPKGLLREFTSSRLIVTGAANGGLDHDGSGKDENPLFDDPAVAEEMLYGMSGGGMMSQERPVDAPGEWAFVSGLLNDRFTPVTAPCVSLASLAGKRY